MTDSKKWIDEHVIISLPDSLCPPDKEVMEKRIKDAIKDNIQTKKEIK